MGMMVRRNMKQRAAKNVASVNVFEKNNFSEITKTDIYKMSTADLRKMAKKIGIENPDEITGVELKKILISKFS